MEIPLFLAMTAAEFKAAEALPVHPAWMACHFSSYGIGISNVPKMLPSGAMLMLNDRTPICGHDPEAIADALCNAAQCLKCDCILLDFQREGYEELKSIIRAVLVRAGCPVGVSALYADGFDCPVLVPPIPPHIIPEEALAPWKGRELWLEVSTEGTQIAVTAEGSRYTPLSGYVPGKITHLEPALHCHYEITVEEERILFDIGRTEEDLSDLLKAAKDLGVSRAIGLWQELSDQTQQQIGIWRPGPQPISHGGERNIDTHEPIPVT